ncbi:MAG: hypothetical protein O9302_02120 [Cyclobacteriaceae bacterium]|nr:hypothetical protein [Cytophagales bacterium]MCZ8326829.1 hypothetical protein [Cyclobacteriaceae bacterium]
MNIWQMMPTASNVYRLVCDVLFDPEGVADGGRLFCSINLVSLRDMKNIGIEA